MATMKKYKFSIWLQNGHHISPIIEAANMSEAIRMAEAQYAGAKHIACMGEVH